MNVVTTDSPPDILAGILNAAIPEALYLLNSQFPGTVTFSTSFSMEDQVITHIIRENNIPISIFTLDTGRMFPETYSVWQQTNERYGIQVQPYYPQAANIENFVAENGPNAFYESVDLRKTCCYIRKVEPLQRALRDQKVWITGLRAEHSPTRNELQQLEQDDKTGIIKYHPLLNWSTEELGAFIHQHQIPYNALHDRGFISIGCAPCTRAVKAGEDFRAGRWWWEDASKKECGLHAR